MTITRLSKRVRQVSVSPIQTIMNRTSELRAQGRNIIELSVGQADFDTAENIEQAAIQSIREGHTRYTAFDGISSLKDAIITKFQRDNGLEYTPEQIIVSVGSIQSLFTLVLALLDDDDEAILIAPYWSPYLENIRFAGGKSVIVKTSMESGFKICAEQLENTITDKTKLLILNSPSNPTGQAYTRSELEALSQVLRRYPHVHILTDDIYEHILWAPEPFANIVMVAPDLAERTIILNGVSKCYAMTGWRIGYAAGPPEIIHAMKKVQSQNTASPPSISQYAALEALVGDQSSTNEMVQVFKQRHDYVVEALNAIDGVCCLPSDGTFYAFPSFKEAINQLDGVDDDITLSLYLLEQAGVALVPGSGFGMSGYLRLSYAASLVQLREAMQRIVLALREIKKNKSDKISHGADESSS